MKEILDIAFELGLNGNNWNTTVEYLRSCTYGKHLDISDFDFSGLIFESFSLGSMEFENESNFYLYNS